MGRLAEGSPVGPLPGSGLCNWMLFNSYEFIVLFLPLTLAGFFLSSRLLGREPAIIWLVLASLFFYGWWNPIYLVLIVLSMMVNFALGTFLGMLVNRSLFRRRLVLSLGVLVNLGLLGYFKYANFFVENLNALADTDYNLGVIVLPLAISFFTFQQIAYLADAYQGVTSEYKFSHYALFVTFFPQLIAGPIVHHKEMLPQFMKDETLSPRWSNVAIGVTIFSIGLFKKAVLADGVAQYATPVFSRALIGEDLTFFEAWGGALSYTFQLYFDFSGYSDMAIGAARLFGIILPLNFFSPYKSTSIVEFWRRWHMTLSRFLRDYVYIPLGGSRYGSKRRYVNLMTTMLLGGLWHGAGWTFVAWGALHGFYLVINHAWNWFCHRIGFTHQRDTALWKAVAWVMTFVSVVVGWVFFRAESFDAALVILKGMAGVNGIALPNALAVRLGGAWAMLQSVGVDSYLGGGSVFIWTYLWVGLLGLLALIAPNTHQFMRDFNPTYDAYGSKPQDSVQPAARLSGRVLWRPSVGWMLGTAILSTLGFLALTSVSEFLYFQF